ncbi:MAG: RloB family protein, partial [Actinomycetia bacterium]|nr:RloB family protein [Actinomycetes bacterium]
MLVEVRAEGKSEDRVREKGKVPSSLVEAASKDKESGRYDVDEYWCVFDVEAPKPHGDLRKALEGAKGGRIRLAVSNPCFELWLLLHHGSQASY